MRFQIWPIDLAEIFQRGQGGFRRRCANNKINTIGGVRISIRHLTSNTRPGQVALSVSSSA
jgi:hypothetical protein